MPLPKPTNGEEKDKYISRCVSFLSDDKPDMPNNQRVAICTREFGKTDKAKSFSVYTKINKSWSEKVDKEGNSERFIEAIVSGIREDLDKEAMTQEAVDDMILQFKSGSVPLFPNHGRDPITGERVYNWEDMMGVWVDASQEGDHLKAVARLNKSHPKSELFWRYIQEGMPIGFSIGGKPVEIIEVNEDGEEKKIQ